MVQLIAICILVFWVGAGIYLYRADPYDNRQCCSGRMGFLFGTLLHSALVTFFATCIAIVIGGLLMLAFGVTK